MSLAYFYGALDEELVDSIEKSILESRKIHRRLHKKRNELLLTALIK